MDSAYRKLLPNPRQSASWLSILFFGWTIPMFKQSYQDESLDSNDAFGPIESDQSDRLGDRLEKYDYTIFSKIFSIAKNNKISFSEIGRMN